MLGVVSVAFAFMSIVCGVVVIFVFSAIYEAGMDRLHIDKLVLAVFVISGLIAILIGSACGYLSRKFYQKRIDSFAMRVVDDVMAEREQRYFLYLRPFITTGNLETAMNNLDISPQGIILGLLGRDSTNFEYRLRRALKTFAPIVGLGMPGEAVGVARVKSTEESWKKVISKLLENAAIVFCVPGVNAGTIWEIKKILESEILTNKTVFIIPPIDARDTKEVWDDVQKILGESKVFLPPWPSEEDWNDAVYPKDYPGIAFKLKGENGKYDYSDLFFLDSLSKRKIHEIAATVDPMIKKRFVISEWFRFLVIGSAILFILYQCAS